ncbi:MAG: ABC transporter permease [Acidimicrobiia bacterium]
MKALTIAWIALVRLLRDRSNIFFVFILPIGIIVLIGSQFGGGFAPTLAVVVEPGAGELGDSLVASIEVREDVSLDRFDDTASAVTAVERGNVQAAIVIPAGYDEALRSGDVATVGFFARPDAAVYQTIVLAAAGDQAALIRAARFASEENGAVFDEALVVATEIEPSVAPVAVEVESVGEAVFSNLGQFDLGASSQLILFMFLTGLTGSAAIIETRRLGVAKRMLSTPTTAGEIVLGEGLGRYAVVLVQGLYIVVVTLLLFGVDWGNPAGAALIMLLFGAVCAATAMLMGTLFKNDQQAAGMGVIIGLGLAALGGCMVPLEFFSDTMQTVAHITPHAWALDAFAVLVREDGTVVDILPELAVLAGFAIALSALASFRLRRSMTTF